MSKEKKVAVMTVETPVGNITATESPDRDNPGIVLQFFTKDGKEFSACSMQYMEEKERVETRVWDKDEPDGDPVYETGFDVYGIVITFPESDGDETRMYMMAELEQDIHNGKLSLDMKVKRAWIGDTEIAVATMEDVAEYLRRNYDFKY